jgi:hypothetical protein
MTIKYLKFFQFKFSRRNLTSPYYHLLLLSESLALVNTLVLALGRRIHASLNDVVKVIVKFIRERI